MTIQLELWQLASAIGSICFVTVAAFWALAKVIAAQAREQIKAQFKTISAHLDAQDIRLTTLEGVVTELRVELAKEYTRREDHVRDIGTLAAKFEALAINVERLFREHGRETLQLIRQEMGRK